MTEGPLTTLEIVEHLGNQGRIGTYKPSNRKIGAIIGTMPNVVKFDMVLVNAITGHSNLYIRWAYQE